MKNFFKNIYYKIVILRIRTNIFNPYRQPKWCNDPIVELVSKAKDHPLMGCWGIYYGYVKKDGIEYCKNCESFRERGELNE